MWRGTWCQTLALLLERYCSLDTEDGGESSGPSVSLGHGQLSITSFGGGPLKSAKEFASSAAYTPYTDDPEEPSDPNMMLQTQRQLMDGVLNSFYSAVSLLSHWEQNRMNIWIDCHILLTDSIIYRCR